MTVPTVLAVFVHPDDESLSAGGLLARSASEGGRTAVVTATWAEGSLRAKELGEELRFLGADSPRLLGCAAARLGHADPAITLRVYSHGLRDQVGEVADVFARLLERE